MKSKKIDLCSNPWYKFFSKSNIKHQIFLLKPHDIIVFDNNLNLYVILLGSLILTKVFKNTKRTTLNVLTSEDIFGHAELINTSSYYEAEAIDLTQIICINYSTVIDSCQKHPTFNIFFINHLLLYSRKTHHFIEMISHKSITNRLVSLLLLLSEQNGTQYSNGILLNFTITHKLLAQIIGSNRVSVTRIMSELLETKLISMQKNKIIIHSPILLSQRSLNK